jgi:hypothetical protein
MQQINEVGDPTQQQDVERESGKESDSALAYSSRRGNEYLQAIVDWTRQRREVDEASMLVLREPLFPSETCKAKKADFDQFCWNYTHRCNGDFTNLLGSLYAEAPRVEHAPRCKTLWFAGVPCNTRRKRHHMMLLDDVITHTVTSKVYTLSPNIIQVV